MKTNIIIVAILSIAIFFTSCKKDEGVGGKATITGTVKYSQGNAVGAVVYITYGTTEKTDAYSNTTTVGEDGTYKFEGLIKGDYYIESKFVDEYDNYFESTGYAITIGSKKSEVTVDLEVK